MLLSMFYGFITGLFILLVIGMLKLAANTLYSLGDNANYAMILLILLLFLASSCAIEEAIDPPTCIDGNCDAEFIVEGTLDENGYYHVDLNWDGQYYPRFNIEILSTITDPWWWYNGDPVIQANFYTGDTWTYGYDELPVVQSTRVYLRKIGENKAYAKRIVGPLPPEFENDTIYIEPEVFWDAGSNSKYKVFDNLKIIVE